MEKMERELTRRKSFIFNTTGTEFEIRRRFIYYVFVYVIQSL